MQNGRDDLRSAREVGAEIKDMKKQIERDGPDSWTRGYLAALRWVENK